MHRAGAIIPLCTALLLLSPACSENTEERADKIAEKYNKAKEEEAKKAAAVPVEKVEPKGLKPGEVALPWSFEKVSGAIELGTVITYDLKGKDAKGKDVADKFRCKVGQSTDEEVGVACNTVEKPSKDKGAGQMAVSGWTEFSPFFTVERPSHELKARETVKVPAGEFDCVVAEIKGYFGAQLTAWMIVDKPGVYAKVVKQANAQAEDDKTELTYELAEIKVEG